MTELVFLYSAESDIQGAFEFYESTQEGRGEVFLKHLDAALGSLAQFPSMGAVVREKYRRLLVPAFPYGVFYVVEGRRIIIAGVMDLRQNPETIRKRIGGVDP